MSEGFDTKPSSGAPPPPPPPPPPPTPTGRIPGGGGGEQPFFGAPPSKPSKPPPPADDAPFFGSPPAASKGPPSGTLIGKGTGRGRPVTAKGPRAKPPSGKRPRPPGSSGGSRRTGSDLGSRVDVLHGRLATLELEVKDLRREMAALKTRGAPAASSAPAAASPRTDGLTPREVEMMQEIELLRGELEALRAGGASGGDEALRKKNQELVEEVERIEGEYQALKLRTEGAAQAKANLDMSDVEVNEETVRELLALNRALEGRLSKTKKTATTKIKRLKSETSTLRTQKENLLKELADRDAGIASDEGELTLEQITDSEVFKTMLGNIRRTSREEVTHLHGAIASLRKIDPAAYKTALTVIAKQFEKANMENPLATLPKE